MVHIITAIYSLGFHHYDEHYQVLEFAALKLGKTTPVELPWEYPARIRPSLQPYIAYYFIKVFNIKEPFFAAMLLRQLSAVLGWFSISVFTLCVIQWFKTRWLQKLLVVLTVVLWFLPYTHVRFSSESWSASFFFLGLSALFVSQTECRRSLFGGELGHIVLAGFCFGLSYVFRMQSVLLLPGVFLWYLIIGRMKFYKLFIMGMMVLLAIGFGVLSDYYFYGNWVNTALRYFYVNILEGKASTFGVEPWWFYFSDTIILGIAPIGFLLIIGVLMAWLRFPKNIITWATVPFFLVHCLVSHKELRFIFPMVNALPVLLVMAVSSVKQEQFENFSQALKKALKWLLYAFVISNAIVMLYVAFQPARKELPVFKYFNDNYFNEEIIIIGYGNGQDPYRSFSTLPMNFYRPANIRTHYTTDTTLINYIVKNAQVPVFLYTKERGFNTPPKLDKLKKNWKIEHYTLSPFYKKLDFNGWVSRTPVYAIYRLKGEE